MIAMNIICFVSRAEQSRIRCFAIRYSEVLIPYLTNVTTIIYMSEVWSRDDLRVLYLAHYVELQSQRAHGCFLCGIRLRQMEGAGRLYE
jgi:hypothetical protein